ncbi:MAG: glycoside hydrolase family 3 protein [Clostridia bacterium]|nr:glycoside hydrolase family 3 protein [Clostridia bacterium]
MLTEKQIESLIDSLTLDEMIGQMLCYNVVLSGDDLSRTEEFLSKTHAGSLFVDGEAKANRIDDLMAMFKKYNKIPGMIAADIENGPGSLWSDEVKLPHPMAWGACGDADLIRRAHEAIAIRCRQKGVHWSFSPLVDINFNCDNPLVNIRGISDRAELVAKIGRAAVQGFEAGGRMMSCAKHFPGDGVDDRNQHFCTTVNSLSKEEWMNTFGAVYKEMFKAGVASVMVAHISLPAYDEKINEWLGYPPASLSYNLQTKLLKEELGYTGCVISDAMSMVGACACVPADRLAIEFFKAGGDLMIFPVLEDFDRIKGAVLSGEIPMERVRDAVRRVIRLKDKARLFEDQDEVLKGIDFNANVEELKNLATEIAEKSLCLVRNYGKEVPLSLKPGDKIFIANIKNIEGGGLPAGSLDFVEEELRNRGFNVVSRDNPHRGDMEEMADAAVVLVNCKISSQDYNGGSLRIGWPQIAPFWRGEVLKHPHVIFTSFGDPYKLHDFPFLKTYINTFSFSEYTQKAFVKALLGEIPFQGKSPVTLKDE